MAKTLAKAGPALLPLIQAALTTVREKSPLTGDYYIRASSLAEICVREEALASRLHMTRMEDIESHQQLTFDLGSGMHWAMQNLVLPRIGALVGVWSCRVCGCPHGKAGAYVARPVVCDSCESAEGGGGGFDYVEEHFFDNDLRVSGHPDGFLRLPDRDDLGLLELKSISDRGFRDVRDLPKFEHVIQLQTYLMLTNLSWGIIVYWNKGAWQNPMVEHLVERDNATIQAIRDMLLSFREAILNGGPLPKRICSSSDCSRAEGCPLREECFAGDAP